MKIQCSIFFWKKCVKDYKENVSQKKCDHFKIIRKFNTAWAFSWWEKISGTMWSEMEEFNVEPLSAVKDEDLDLISNWIKVDESICDFWNNVKWLKFKNSKLMKVEVIEIKSSQCGTVIREEGWMWQIF